MLVMSMYLANPTRLLGTMKLENQGPTKNFFPQTPFPRSGEFQLNLNEQEGVIFYE